jgi:hypothetical protein
MPKISFVWHALKNYRKEKFPTRIIREQQPVKKAAMLRSELKKEAQGKITRLMTPSYIGYPVRINFCIFSYFDINLILNYLLLL